MKIWVGMPAKVMQLKVRWEIWVRVIQLKVRWEIWVRMMQLKVRWKSGLGGKSSCLGSPHAWVYIYTSTCACVYVYTRPHACVYIYVLYIYTTCMSVNKYMLYNYKQKSKNIYAYNYIHMHIYMNIYIHIYMHTSIYI